MTRWKSGLLIGLIVGALAGGCAIGSDLSAADKRRLDSLDATGVVRAYFSSGDPEIELYLSTPAQRRLRRAPNFVGNYERAGGVENLVLERGEPADWPVAGAKGWADLRQFVVKYTSHRTNDIGEPPGRRFFFVYTARSPQKGLWKIVSIGTGP